jgi:hypothetical protein
VLADRPHETAKPRARDAKRVAGKEHAPAEVERVVDVFVEDLVDLAGAHAARQERGDDGAGAAAHVDIEARAAAVESFLERPHDADLVHPPDDATAGERQGVTWAGPGVGPAAPKPYSAMYELHELRE